MAVVIDSVEMEPAPAPAPAPGQGGSSGQTGAGQSQLQQAADLARRLRQRALRLSRVRAH